MAKTISDHVSYSTEHRLGYLFRCTQRKFVASKRAIKICKKLLYTVVVSARKAVSGQCSRVGFGHKTQDTRAIWNLDTSTVELRFWGSRGRGVTESLL